jgi:hypothetical protein
MLLAALELDWKDRRPAHEGGVDPTPQPGHIELQEEHALDTSEGGSKDGDLLNPGAPLPGIQSAARVRHGEDADHRLRRGGEKLRHRCAVVRGKRAPLTCRRHGERISRWSCAPEPSAIGAAGALIEVSP